MKKLLLISLLCSFSCEGTIAFSDAPNGIGQSPHGTKVLGEKERDKKKDNDDPSLTQIPIDNATSPTSLSRITRAEYIHTVRDIFGDQIDIPIDRLPIDDRTDKIFKANPGSFASPPEIESYWSMSTLIADQVDLDSLCTSKDIETCSKEFLGAFGPRLLKRNISPETVAAFVEFAREKSAEGSTREQILTSLLSTLLNMPEFLYHIAPASDGDVQKVDGYVIAQRLSSFLFQENPSQLLLDAAAIGELDTPKGIEKHTRRMLADPKSDRAIIAFHTQWLGVDALPALTSPTFPEFENLKSFMITELELFSTNTVREGTFSDLLGGSYSYINADLGRFYGIEGLGDGFERVDNIPHRKGILTQAAVLASSGNEEYTQPIFRGLFYITNILCSKIGPPADIAQIAASAEKTEQTFTDDMSDREKLGVLTSPPECAFCHQSIDPYGYAAEMYDVIGKYRDLDYSGKEIDSSVVLKNQGDLDGEYTSAVELSQTLSQSQTFRQCYTQQWLRFALGHDISLSKDDGIIYEGAQTLKTTNDIKELLVKIATSFAFRHRLPNPG